MRTLKLSPSNTVGEWVVDRPSRSRVFETLGIDYCCGGKRPLTDACGDKGLATDEVVEALLQEDAPQDSRDWSAAALTDLCDHIEATHHAYLRTEIPRLSALTAKVGQVHGPKHPEMVEVARIFSSLGDELTSHMAKEEQVLFPMIRELDQASSRPVFHCGSIANPIRMMEYEHDGAGDGLAQLRRLTNDYTCPPDGCNTWRAMCDGLQQFEADLHQHIHKENNILFPRSLQLESSLD